MRLLRTTFLLALLSAACGNFGVRTRPEDLLPDGGIRPKDAGTTVLTDGGVASVAGKIIPPTFNGPRRGPIILKFGLQAGASEITDLKLEGKAGDEWRRVTTSTVEKTATSALYVWESFSDVAVDGPFTIRLIGKDQTGDISGEVTIDVRNNPETDRLVLTGHDLVAVEGGGWTSNGTLVSALKWQTKSETFGARKDFHVGRGPEALKAAPHGRATAIVEDRDMAVSIVFTPLDADPNGVYKIATVAPPYGGTATARWSPDGRYLYIAGYRDQGEPAMIWRVEPSEDLSTVSAPEALGILPGPPSQFAVEPGTGRIFVTCGPGTTDPGVKSKLLLFDNRGNELSRLEMDIDFANQVVFHPKGGLALWLAEWSGYQVRRFAILGDTLTELTPVITNVEAPADIVFHPGSTKQSGAALVANAEKNRVTPLELSGETVTPRSSVGGIPLSQELDLIERGSQTGMVFSTAVTAFYRVKLGLDASAQGLGKIYEFSSSSTGDGPPEELVSGISVQR